MSIHEKAELIKYINYCEQLGERDRRCFKKQTVQFISGWLGGAGHARKEVAAELRQFIEIMEFMEVEPCDGSGNC